AQIISTLQRSDSLNVVFSDQLLVTNLKRTNDSLNISLIEQAYQRSVIANIYIKNKYLLGQQDIQETMIGVISSGISTSGTSHRINTLSGVYDIVEDLTGNRNVSEFFDV